MQHFVVEVDDTSLVRAPGLGATVPSTSSTVLVESLSTFKSRMLALRKRRPRRKFDCGMTCFSLDQSRKSEDNSNATPMPVKISMTFITNGIVLPRGNTFEPALMFGRLDDDGSVLANTFFKSTTV